MSAQASLVGGLLSGVELQANWQKEYRYYAYAVLALAGRVRLLSPPSCQKIKIIQIVTIFFGIYPAFQP